MTPGVYDITVELLRKLIRGYGTLHKVAKNAGVNREVLRQNLLVGRAKAQTIEKLAELFRVEETTLITGRSADYYQLKNRVFIDKYKLAGAIYSVSKSIRRFSRDTGIALGTLYSVFEKGSCYRLTLEKICANLEGCKPEDFIRKEKP